MSMFCYQCEQTVQGKCCTQHGICGKDAKAVHLQDLLIAWCKHIATTAPKMRELDNRSDVIDSFLLEALYTTLTNVNFDVQELTRLNCQADLIFQLAEYLTTEKKPEYQASLEKQILDQQTELTDELVNEFVEQGKEYSIDYRRQEQGALITGLQELVLYGLKGTAAYTWHALPLLNQWRQKLSFENQGLQNRIKELNARVPKERELKQSLKKEIQAQQEEMEQSVQMERKLMEGIYDTLAFLATSPTDIESLVSQALTVGTLNLQAMELLEKGHIKNFGVPSPTAVRTTPVAGKCILVSGHDLRDLYELLIQTEGKDINIYTHGEMLPAHAYPVLRKFPHFVGHYGGAWYQQQKEFDAFPGAILMTTNCLIQPGESYKDYLFTTGPVHWPGVKHIEPDKNGNKDFSPLIQAALDSPGYFKSKPGEKITVGFGADAITGIADQLRKAINQGQLRHFFLIGGCDGASDKRSYYEELATKIPEDCVILTLGCGKFRFNRLALAPLASGHPRLMDVGQCNDAYSAIRIARFLAEEFQCGINELPLSLFLSWFEQKAIAVLLTLLSLGVKGIRLGPTMPAFLEPEAVQLLMERFDLKPITSPVEDLADCLTPP